MADPVSTVGEVIGTDQDEREPVTSEVSIVVENNEVYLQLVSRRRLPEVFLSVDAARALAYFLHQAAEDAEAGVTPLRLVHNEHINRPGVSE